MTYVFLAEGFEEVEALAPVDILRRAGREVQTVSITESRTVVGAHNVPIVADALLSDVDLSQAEALVLPGGLPGSTNLDACQPLCQALAEHCQKGRLTAAICAAPMVLGRLGLLQGKKATCYPGFDTHLAGATYTAALTERDANIVTGKGPGAALAFGFALLDYLGTDSAPLRAGMMCD